MLEAALAGQKIDQLHRSSSCNCQRALYTCSAHADVRPAINDIINLSIAATKL